MRILVLNGSPRPNGNTAALSLRAGDDKLVVKADACVRCRHCNKRCPFHVDQMARLTEIAG